MLLHRKIINVRKTGYVHFHRNRTYFIEKFSAENYIVPDARNQLSDIALGKHQSKCFRLKSGGNLVIGLENQIFSMDIIFPVL